MKGVLTIIPASGAVSSKKLAAPPALEDLQGGVGGYIELVPGFNHWQGERCVAFCDEDGKRKKLPYNMRATKRWYDQMQGPFIRKDVLVGPIVIVTGDRELMEEL